MKVNKIMLLSIFLLAVLTLGVASASENTTDNLKIDDAVDVSSSADGNIVADEGSGQPKDVEIVLPDSIKAYEEFNINVTLPEDAYGEVSYYFDDNEDDEDSSYVYPGFNQISLKIREFGTHTLNVDFTSEDCEICNDKVVSKKYNINDYGIDISVDYAEWEYGEVNYVSADIPSNTGKVVVDINGEKFNIDLEEDSVWIPYRPGSASNVTVKVTYTGDGKSIKAKTAEKVFAILPKVYIPNEVLFNSSSDVVVNYADGEQFKFILRDYDDESIICDEMTVTVKDSKAVYSIPDNLEFDKAYCLDVIYNNATVANNNFDVIPNMNLPNKFYSKKTYDIPVIFSEEYKNKNLTVAIGDNLVFNGKTDNTGKCNVHLSDLAVCEEEYIYIEIIGDDGNIIYSYSRGVKVSDVDPSCVNLNADVPSENIKGSEIMVDFTLPEGISGEVITYVDGSEISRTPAFDMMTIYIETGKLALGTHILTFNYTGDGYFEPKVSSYLFNVSTYVVDIPETLYYNNNSDIIVKLPEDATGTLIIYADGKQVKKYDVDDEVEDLDEHEITVRCPVDLLNLPVGSHDIRVYYKGNKVPIDVTKKINLDYTIPIYVDNFIYGGENLVGFNLPEDIKGSFNVTIGGKPVKYRAAEDGYCEVNVTEYFGNHLISVEYSGDAKYNHPVKVTKTFTTAAYINYDGYVTYKSKNEGVSLVLPNDAKGNLVVEVDGEIYAKKAFENGRAAISFDMLGYGDYNVRVYYDGDDYYVENRTFDLSVNYNILVSSEEILFNESVEFYINLPSYCNGTLSVFYDGNEFSERVVDGYAKVTLSGLKLGSNDYSADFTEDGEVPIICSRDGSIQVNPIIDISDNFVVFGKNIVSVLVPSGFKGKVSCYGSNGYLKEAAISSRKTDVSMPLVTAGLYGINVDVYDVDDNYIFSQSYEVRVSKAAAPKLFATSATVYNGFNYNVKILGTDGEPLKGAKVSFKVGKNKAVTKKTNANGIASLPMKYKPAKYTVAVKYAKQTLKPKVTVKKVLSLKSAVVKKSAKKLVLTATLKKGKTPIGGKLVSFKFNGKTYKAKTNAKGIAKATIKSTVLKKLKVGKKVTYQVTYLKEVVKKSAKIKK